MTQVQVDWLSVVLAPVIIVSLGIALFAMRRKTTNESGRAVLPTWGRVAQTIGVVCALLVGFVQIVWGN